MDQRIFKHAARLRRNGIANEKILANLKMNGLTQEDAEFYVRVLDVEGVDPVGEMRPTLAGALASFLSVGAACGAIVYLSTIVHRRHFVVCAVGIALAGLGLCFAGDRLLRRLGIATERERKDSEANESLPFSFVRKQR